MSRAVFLDAMRDATGVDLHPTTLKRIEDGTQIARVNEAVALAYTLGRNVEDWMQVDPPVIDSMTKMEMILMEVGVLGEKWDQERSRIRAAWERLTEDEKRELDGPGVRRCLDTPSSELSAVAGAVRRGWASKAAPDDPA